MAAFVQELQKLGYVEGQNIVIDARSAEGDMGRLPHLVKDLVAVAPNVIFAVGTPVMALKSSGTSIPVVFAGEGGDPVRIGLINSLARPGGNLTGMLNVAIDIAGKRLQLLKELLPGIARAGCSATPVTRPASRSSMSSSKTALPSESRLCLLISSVPSSSGTPSRRPSYERGAGINLDR